MHTQEVKQWTLSLTETVFRLEFEDRTQCFSHDIGVQICIGSCFPFTAPPHCSMADDPYRSTDFNLTIPQRMQAYFRSCTDTDQYEGFETHPLQQVTFVSHSEALQQVVYQLVVPKSLCNKDAQLHGGAATTLLDNLSSTALFTTARPGHWENMGVSRSLYVVFHRAVPAGTKVQVICSVATAGRSMASLRAEMRTEDQGLLCVSCVHEKFAVRVEAKL